MHYTDRPVELTMTPDEITHKLVLTELFGAMDPLLLAKIGHVAYYKKINKDEFLIKENTVATEMYVIVGGEFSVSKYSDSDTAVHAHFPLLKPYMTVGELSFLDEQPRSANVKAIDETCEVVAIPYKALKQLAPIDFYRELSKKLSLNVRSGNNTIIKNLLQEVEQSKKMANMGRFISYILLLMSFYDLALKGFVSLSSNPYTSMFGSTAIIFIFTVVLIIMVKHMGQSLQHYGFNTHNWKIAVLESLLFTSIVLIFLTLFKGIISYYQDIPFIDLQAIVPIAKIGTITFYLWFISGLVVYAFFCILQEVITRGILQNSLVNFLEGPHRYLLANIITSVIFSAIHIHLSTFLAYAVFFPSLFWGWLANRHGTLISPIISHILIGSWVVFGLGFQGLLS